MTISKRMAGAINEQINAEFYSAYLYLAMSAYFEGRGLSGFAHWMRTQAREEVEHALRFYQYLFERGGQVVLEAIAKPVLEWKSPLVVFEETLKHEQKVTKMIYRLADLAETAKDRASSAFLQWFIDEQVEEEDSAGKIVQKLKLVGGSNQGLLMLDGQLAERKK